MERSATRSNPITRSLLALTLLLGPMTPGRAQAEAIPIQAGLPMTTLRICSSIVPDLSSSSSRQDDKRVSGRLAELYLRQHEVQLTEELTTGDGPLLAEVGEGLALPPERLAAFRRLSREHRTELLELADTRRLTPDRATRFFLRLADLRDTAAGNG